MPYEVGLRCFNGFYAQNAVAAAPVHFDHLFERAFGGINQVVGKDNGKGFVSDGGAGAQDGVSQAQCFRLTDVEAGNVRRQDVADVFQQFVFMAHFQLGFEFVCLVEMVFDAAFVASGNKHHFRAAGFHGFFYGVLDQRLVDDGQHFFRACLGGGQEACSHPCDGEDGFPYGFHSFSFVLF